MVATASKGNVPVNLVTEVNNVKKKYVSTTAPTGDSAKATLVYAIVASVDSTVPIKSVSTTAMNKVDVTKHQESALVMKGSSEKIVD